MVGPHFTEDFLHELTFSRPVRRYVLFSQVPVNERGDVLMRLSSRVRRSLLIHVPNDEIIALLHYADLDRVARIVRDVKEGGRRKTLVAGLARDVREKVEVLLRFQPGTAAELMNFDYLLVDHEMTFGDVSSIMRAREKKTGKTPTLLVTKAGFLVGELPLHTLVSRKPSQVIRTFIRKIPTVMYDARYVRVLHVFRGNPHRKVVVFDRDKSVLGIIYSSDLLDVIDRSGGERLYGFAGVRKEEDMRDSWTRKVRNRYAWLILNLVTVLAAALVVHGFEDTISHLVFLVAYMPVVAGMGGNAGMQTLAVVVRGLAMQRVPFRTGARIALNEVLASLVNGSITGGLVALVAFFLSQNPLLGLIVLVSIVINLVIAGFFGTLVPLVMQRLGKDPAISASIFITTATDVSGFFVFLGLASLFLR